MLGYHAPDDEVRDSIRSGLTLIFISGVVYSLLASVAGSLAYKASSATRRKKLVSQSEQ